MGKGRFMSDREVKVRVFDMGEGRSWSSLKKERRRKKRKAKKLKKVQAWLGYQEALRRDRPCWHEVD